jgi:hypothetical protein
VEGGNDDDGGRKHAGDRARLDRRCGRDACSLGRGRRREGVASGAVGAENNGGTGKKLADDGGGTLLKWRGGEATEGGGSGGEGATRRNSAMGPGPRQASGVPTTSPIDRGPAAAHASGTALFE